MQPLDILGGIVDFPEGINHFLNRILRIVNLVYDIVRKLRYSFGG